MRAISKFIASNLRVAGIVLSPWIAFNLIFLWVLALNGYTNENIPDWYDWVLLGSGALLIGGMSGLVSAPKSLKQCLREEGLA